MKKQIGYKQYLRASRLKKRLLIFSISGLLLTTVNIKIQAIVTYHAQNVTSKELYVVSKPVRGVVTDDNNEPLEGVSVIIKGSTDGATTSSTGQYSLNVPDNNTVLIFSYVGYVSQEIMVGNKDQIDVKLTFERSSLNEVVVVGYGAQQKKSLTGSVANINSEQLNTAQTADLVNLMAGKLPGVRVAQKTGSPGNNTAYIDIRGFGSPLILVDGVPNERPRTIDPDDIESISVLKDASAAVYGVRAANGVVLITTKRGKKGKSEISYKGSFGYSHLTNANKPLDVYRYAILQNEARYNGGASGISGGYNALVNNGKVTAPPRYTEDQIKKFEDGSIKGTDWYGLVINEYAPTTEHNLSVNGGTDKVRYYISLGYLKELGLWKSGDLNFNKYFFRSNITAQLNNYIEAEMLINGIQSLLNEPMESNAGVINITLRPEPDQTPYANNNLNYLNILPSADNRHPLVGTNANLGGYRSYGNKNFSGQFALNIKVPFVSGLKARLMYNRNNSYSIDKDWRKKYTLYTFNPTNESYTPRDINSPSRLTEAFSEITISTLQGSTNYNKQFNELHNLGLQFIAEQINYKLSGFNGSKRFALDAIDYFYAGIYDGQQTINDIGLINNINVSFIGRLNYDYASKYFFEATFNQNGSSKFGPGQRWGFFPATSLGWRLSEEKFISDRFKFINNLKLRASWGKLGDDASSTFQWLTGYTYPSGNYIFLNDQGTALGSIPALGFKGQANPYITWYLSETINFGLDGDFWNSKMAFEFDVFRRDRKGLLQTRSGSIPATLGTTLPQENLSSDRTEGFELLLNHNNKINNFRYKVSANFAYARPSQRSYDHAPFTSSYHAWRNNNTNRYTGISWGYGVVGQYNSFDEIINSPLQTINNSVGLNHLLLPGDIRYLDYNEDGIIDDNDVHPIGIINAAPEINYGLTFDLGWKGIDVNILFTGGDLFFVRYAGLHLEYPLNYGNNAYEIFYDRWHRANPNDPNSQEWISGKFPPTRIQGAGQASALNHLQSTFWVHNASFFRLKSTEIGYSFTQPFLKRAGISKMRVYVNGFNLLTWSGLKIVDPELWNSQSGLEYPITQNYNIGLNLTF